MIVTTIPTGNIGGAALRLLLDKGSEDVRVVVRDPAKLDGAVRERVDVVAGSHGDADVVAAAFEGADAVLWIVPPNPSAPSLETAFSGFTRAAVDALPASGVSHVVGVSALGRGTPFAADAGLVTASLAVDDLIASTGVAYRALANPSFMENVLRQRDAIRDRGVFTDTVAPDRRAPSASTRDIAAVAADLLLDRSWTGNGSRPILGPEDISADEMAAVMSEVLGRPVRYERESLDDLASRLAGFGMGAAFVAGMVDMMRAKDQGLDAGIDRTADTASPTTFRQWCTEVLEPAVRS
jgi:uncharacterized protein YbjT (DUF2867 family)